MVPLLDSFLCLIAFPLSNSTNISKTPSFCSCMKSFPKLWVVCLVFRGRFCKYLRRDMHKHPKRLTGDTDMWQWKALAFQCQCLSSENGLSEQAVSYWWSRSQFDKAQRERPSFTTLGPIAGRGRGGTQQGARLGTEGQWKSRPSRPEGPKLLTILLLLLPTFPWLPYKIANIEPSLDNTSLLSSDFNSWKLFKSMGNLFHISFEGKVYFKTRIH